jgi:hypothetical protein
MNARMRCPARLNLLIPLLLAAVCPQRARAEAALPLAVRAGQCQIVLDTPGADDQFYLVIGSLARAPGPFRVAVCAEPTSAPADPPPAVPVPNASEAEYRQQLSERLERARRQSVARAPLPPQAAPRERVFHLFTGDQDFHDPRAYTTVFGELRTVGRHCQVYVDRDHADRSRLQPTVEDAVRTFDEDIYPRARQQLGQALDVDRDGRFTILFTGWLDRLQRGQVALGGFVRGSDFYRDMAPPFGNRCDVMYLNTNLKPGPHLRTLLAHEYTHAVVFSEHVFGEYLPVASRQDEDSWLNEALAHLNEEAHGYSWSNLDYRVSAFLNAPHRYRLVVRDYYLERLWRDPGTRGSAYLFLRWCNEAVVPGLPGRLVRSNLQGVLNLEVATQRAFGALFRDWSTSLLQGGAGTGTRLNVHYPLGSRLLCGPRFEEVALGGGRQDLSLAGTGVAYVLLHSPAGARSRVTVTSDEAADLQVTLVRVPRGRARVSVRCEECPEGVRLSVTAHGSPVRLEDAAWERLVPSGEAARDTSYRPGQSAAEWFGTAELRTGQTCRSEAIRLPTAEGARGTLVFKVAGTDASGARVAGWAVYEPEASRP